jgi:hypothetical protein
VIAIDGWSKKAAYMERHTSWDEAMARVHAINADGSQDTAFAVEAGEETFRHLSPEALYQHHLQTEAWLQEFDHPPSAA